MLQPCGKWQVGAGAAGSRRASGCAPASARARGRLCPRVSTFLGAYSVFPVHDFAPAPQSGRHDHAEPQPPQQHAQPQSSPQRFTGVGSNASKETGQACATTPVGKADCTTVSRHLGAVTAT